jgi:hypothetical protein
MVGVMGYRPSLLRGLENVRGEWNLVTMSGNIKRMFAMQPLLRAAGIHMADIFQSTSL